MSTVYQWTIEEYEALGEVAERVFTDWRHPRHIELIYGYLNERGEPAKLSLEEYERMVAAGVFAGPRRRLELIEGEILKMSPINPPHAFAVRRVVDWSYENTSRRAVEVRVQSPLRLTKLDSEPEPDVVWVVPGNYARRHPQEDEVLLLIEVADTSVEEDTGRKSRLYAKAGIRDYWVVNLRNHTVEVRRNPGPDGYQDLAVYSGNDELRPLACAEVVLIPSSLWAPISEADDAL